MIEDAVARSPEETESAGRRLAGGLTATDVVYLLGGLGSGKTCFARGLASGLGASAREVASPTFAIVHEYASPGGDVVLRHLDLYRVPHPGGVGADQGPLQLLPLLGGDVGVGERAESG